MNTTNTIVANAMAAKNASVNDEMEVIEKNTTRESDEFTKGTTLASTALRKMGQKMLEMVDKGIVSKKTMDTYQRQCGYYDKVYSAITGGRNWR